MTDDVTRLERQVAELLEWKRDALRALTDAGHQYATLRQANEELAAKHRQLRLHVRKDGKLKEAQPKDAAEEAARRMTEKHGKQFDAYPCSLCNGLWHVGHLRDVEADT